MDDTKLHKEIMELMWAGNQEGLWRVAGCECCCNEHTSTGCLARIWGGCRGQGSEVEAEYKHWYESQELEWHPVSEWQYEEEYKQWVEATLRVPKAREYDEGGNLWIQNGPT